MVKHLYIIGNGFDIHHDIPSKYFDNHGGDCFRKWLEMNNYDLLYAIDENFGFQTNEWWEKFEENLASVDTLRIAYEEAFEHYPNFGDDNFRDKDWDEAGIAIEIRLDSLYVDISNALKKWVVQLPKGNDKKRIRLVTEQSIFISFNYTQTLEDLYLIPPERILHIHGCVDGESLIFGHGAQYSDLQKKMEKVEKVETGDFVYQIAKDSALYNVASHKKDVDSIIDKHKYWFDNLSNITHVHIFGHSLSKVDLPYFSKIFDSCNKQEVIVEISCFDEESIEKAEWFVKSFSIPIIHFIPTTLKSIQML